ncbi:T-cell surface antigen CD2-like [Brienomyrus brachyistius]|uniref:T-cell surface antigen CD2-like n=1 Tax=Brienomyrus brachyistius TaxID=42636 RepID=UPI0020B45D9D|nr:T-cell surface antigen CD2-like [Brienomyrus brachyistius]XP_048860823.1 T-cell surface antigen CD2-like [Brienomyrus brachyistius]XP_048860825.1 T-cell surface antigen CD2-like [Brienomyrus brachyistius]
MWKIVFIALTIVADIQGTQESCMTVATGAAVTLPLNYPDFKKDDELIWKHNATTILKRKKQRFVSGQESSMMPDGSLRLTGLQLHDSGSYQVEVYNSDGELVRQSSVTLCVMEKVSEPTVNYRCGMQLNLTCYLEKRPGRVTFEWTRNNITVEGDNGETLTVDRKLASGDTFSCKARNEVSQEKSPSVPVKCGGLGPTISTLTQQSTPSGYDLPTPWLKPLLLLSVFCCLLMTYF